MNIDDIKIVFIDVDGTLTDGKIYFGPDGECLKAFNVKDGYAVTILKQYGITPVIVTGRTTVIVEKRAADLKVEEIYQGVENKLNVIEMVREKHRVRLEQCIYIGDDLNDIEAMKACGYAACPADAADEVKEISYYVARNRAGEGAVREIIDIILRSNGNKLLFDN